MTIRTSDIPIVATVPKPSPGLSHAMGPREGDAPVQHPTASPPTCPPRRRKAGSASSTS